MKIYTDKENINVGDLTKKINKSTKVISETRDTRFKIKKVDPEHFIIKRLNQRITYLEVKVDQQDAWITILLDKLLTMTKDQVH